MAEEVKKGSLHSWHHRIYGDTYGICTAPGCASRRTQPDGAGEPGDTTAGRYFVIP
jgi:hypothetical protein